MGQVLARVRTLLPGVRVCPGRAGVRGHVVVDDLGPPVVGPRSPAYAWPSRVLADVRVDLAMLVKNAKGVAWCPEARGRGSHAQAVRQQVNRLRGRPNSWRPGPDPCSGEFVWIGGFPVWCRGTTGAHHLRPGRVRPRRTARRSQRLPPQGRPPGRVTRRDPCCRLRQRGHRPRLAPRFLDTYAHKLPGHAGGRTTDDGPGALTTEREREILVAIGRGWMVKAQVGPKIGARDRIQAVILACDLGLTRTNTPGCPLVRPPQEAAQQRGRAPTRRGRLIQAWRPTSPLLAVRGNGSRRRGGRAAAVRPRTATQPSAPPFAITGDRDRGYRYPTN